MIATSCYGILWVVLCGVNLFGKGDGACQWPTAVRDTQWHSSRGVITFTSTNMDGWAFRPVGSTGISVSAWECLSSANFATDGTLIMLTRTSFNEFVRISTNYYAYLCITLTQVTTASYQFYIRNEVPPDWGSERLYLSIVNSVTEPSRICNYTHGASGPEYNMLIRVGSESAAKVTCPYTFLGRYGYTHFSSRGYFTCSAATSELDACTNTQHMKFNYTACSTSVTFSQSDTVWCVNNVFMNDANYVTTFNGNDADGVIDNTNFYRYACMAVWSNASAASVAPQQCRSGQTPGAFVTTHAGIMLGGQLTTLSSRGASCQKCETLSNPPRGNVAIATSGSVTTATYTCQASYTLWGNVSRVCQADNKWSGAEPFCNCSVPPTPASGSVLLNSDGTVATFSCNVGYTLSGIRTRTCQNGLTWDGSNPTCVKCQTLASVSGQTSSLSTNATVTSATFTCANGYTLSGTASMTCASTGNWNDVQPACKKCETLSNPPRGNVAIATSGSVTTATYTCQASYTLWGNVSRVCQADNKWSGAEPFCNCAVPPTPASGSVLVNSDGTVATFSCNVGYTLSGIRTRTCQNGLTWDGSNPTCVKCQTLASVSGQTSSLSSNATVTSATFTCANGYTLSGTASMTCASTGNWNDVQPACTNCKTLTNPLSGTVTLSTNGQVTKATYSCSSGYTLQGVANRTCFADGNWDGADSTCSCEPGYFGLDCTSPCHCKEGLQCDHVSGKCSVPNCIPGWTGENCSIKQVAGSSTVHTMTSLSSFSKSTETETTDHQPNAPFSSVSTTQDKYIQLLLIIISVISTALGLFIASVILYCMVRAKRAKERSSAQLENTTNSTNLPSTSGDEYDDLSSATRAADNYEHLQMSTYLSDT